MGPAAPSRYSKWVKRQRRGASGGKGCTRGSNGTILILDGHRLVQPKWLAGTKQAIPGLGVAYGCGERPGYSLPVADLDEQLGFPRTCAVVGSSALMLDERWGAEIDAHDAIFRANEAPAGRQFARHVGRNTSVRTVNILVGNRPGCPQGRTEFEDDFYTKAAAARCRAEAHVINVINILGAPLRAKRDEPQQVLSEGFLRWAAAETAQPSGFPSTGIMNVLLARRMCQSVRLYGYDFFTCPSGKRHYYKDQDGRSNCKEESWLNHQWMHEELYVARHYGTRCTRATFPTSSPRSRSKPRTRPR
jgi:hypothetical protein